jgi:predicted nucleic acid-binding protein
VPTVSNSSPLIALAAIGQFHLLPALYDVVLIPAAVSAEIQPSIPKRPDWLQLKPLANAVPAVVGRRGLGAGEREAISLSLELSAKRVILDDRPARRLAQALGLKVVGTLGILLVAKRRGLIERVRPLLDALAAQSFFMSAQLYRELLDLAAEHDT